MNDIPSEAKAVLIFVAIVAVFLGAIVFGCLKYYSGINKMISTAADPAAMSCAIYGTNDSACIIAASSKVEQYKLLLKKHK